MSGTGEVRRRWVNESVVLAELEALNDTSMALVAEYRADAIRAAEAEALHKVARAKRILSAQASGIALNGRAMAMNQAEVTAEADDAVADALQARLVAAARADATKEALRSVRTNQDGLRTAAASHRSPMVGPGYA